MASKTMQSAVDDWNEHVKIGARVSYRKDDGSRMLTKTRSRAQVLSNHTPVVWLDRVSGCVLLNRVVPWIDGSEARQASEWNGNWRRSV